mgnify:CR=1 FL=1
MRKVIVAGNWKMNKTVKEAVSFLSELKPLVSDVKNAGIVIGHHLQHYMQQLKKLKVQTLK